MLFKIGKFQARGIFARFFIRGRVVHRLDEWYIRNASLQLDLRIVFMTFACLFRGERRSEEAIAAAFAMRRQQCVLPDFETVLAPAPATSEPAPATSEVVSRQRAA